MQQKTQCDPDESRRGEAPNPAPSGAETAQAQPERESPSSGDSLMEAILSQENLRQALKRVKANKGAPGGHPETRRRHPTTGGPDGDGQVHPAGGDVGDGAGRTKMETHNHVSGGQVVPGGGTITKRMRCPAVSMTIHTEHIPARHRLFFIWHAG